MLVALPARSRSRWTSTRAGCSPACALGARLGRARAGGCAASCPSSRSPIDWRSRSASPCCWSLPASSRAREAMRPARPAQGARARAGASAAGCARSSPSSTTADRDLLESLARRRQRPAEVAARHGESDDEVLARFVGAAAPARRHRDADARSTARSAATCCRGSRRRSAIAWATSSRCVGTRCRWSSTGSWSCSAPARALTDRDEPVAAARPPRPPPRRARAAAAALAPAMIGSSSTSGQSASISSHTLQRGDALRPSAARASSAAACGSCRR